MSSSRIRSRVRMPAAQRREQILEEATALIGRWGYWGVSIQDVADACGLAQTGLLHHFGSKDALLVAVLERRDHLDAEALAARLGLGGDVPPENFSGLDLTLAELLDAIVERNAEQREIVRLYAVLQAESLTPDHPAHAFFAERQRRALDLIAHAVPAGHDARALARHVLAVLDGLQLQWLRDPDMDLVAAWRDTAMHSLRPLITDGKNQ